MNCKCRVCGNSEHNEIYTVKERALNKGDKFEYMLCSKCKTLQLNEEILNMGGYYEDNYYSYTRKSVRLMIPKFIVKPILKWYAWNVGMPYMVDRFLSKKILPMSSALKGVCVKFSEPILDVGSGNGIQGEFWGKNGFDDVTCIDLFCTSSPFKHISFKQCDIKDLNENKKYGLITFFSSFEHMQNPLSVMQKVKVLLAEHGKLMITIPIFGSNAWEMYRDNWFQIDAPRHYFIYSPEAVEYLCKKCGLKVERIEYKSSPYQFIVSKYYKESDLSLGEIYDEIDKLPRKEMRKYEKMAIDADLSKKGDYARFIITHEK